MKFCILFGLILCSLSCVAKSLCFAHRGGGKAYFDNSIDAIKGAIENKFEGIEIDIQQSKDGEIILLHDENLSEVGMGKFCPLETPIHNVVFSVIRERCRLKNGEYIPRLTDAFDLLRNKPISIILDLKNELNEDSIKVILESGVTPSRLRLTAFNPNFLSYLGSVKKLNDYQVKTWNSIPRYENFRHPVFNITNYFKNFHLFSAYAYAAFASDNHFGAWEVNYQLFLKLILPLNPDFIVTKIPKECMRLRHAR